MPNNFAVAAYRDELTWLAEVARQEAQAARAAATAAHAAAAAEPENADLEMAAKEAARVARETSVPLQFFRGTWGAREVAAFLGLDSETVRHCRAGLRDDLPPMRMGKGKKKTLRWLPRDVIYYRERMRSEAEDRVEKRRRLRRVS